MNTKRHLSLLASFGAALGLLGCPATPAPSPSYPPKTTLALETPRCSGGSCRCRPLDSNDNQAEEKIPAGLKRFEFRLPRTTSAIWVEVGTKGHYYKPPQRVLPECFYVDLPKGQTPVVIYSKMHDRDVGLQTGLTIFEHGTKEGPNWYRVFDYSCGGMNRCTKAGMEAWVAFMRQLPRKLFNPCGSVRIRQVSVGGTRELKTSPEYNDVTARFTLDIYDFEPYKNPASVECGSAKRR